MISTVGFHADLMLGYLSFFFLPLTRSLFLCAFCFFFLIVTYYSQWIKLAWNDHLPWSLSLAARFIFVLPSCKLCRMLEVRNEVTAKNCAGAPVECESHILDNWNMRRSTIALLAVCVLHGVPYRHTYYISLVV